MRMIAKEHYPKAKLGEIVDMEGATYKVLQTTGTHLVLQYAPKGKAKHLYQTVEHHRFTEEQINREENKRELVAEMDFEAGED